MLDIYPWQHDQMQRLSAMYSQERLPHALMFSGTEGIGLKQFSLSLAVRLLCAKNDNFEIACGLCDSCNLVKGDSHPDLKLIEPEENSERIQINQIREFIDYSTLKSFSGKIKICIINPAEMMVTSAANALLKTLEEPPSQTIVILLTHRASRLPITIRSRCQRVNFQPAFNETAVSWIDKKLNQPDVSANSLLHLSNGGPLRALELVNDDLLTLRQKIAEDLDSITKKTNNSLKIAEKWYGLGHPEEVISILMQIMNDLIRLKLCLENAKIVNIDLREDLQGIVNRLDLVKLMRSYDFISLKYKDLGMPMNYSPLAIFEEIALFLDKMKD